MEAITVFTMTGNEFDTLVNSKLNLPRQYEFAAEQEVNNDCWYRFDIDLDDSYSIKWGEWFLTGKYIHNARGALYNLVKNGYLQPGIYFIDPSW